MGTVCNEEKVDFYSLDPIAKHCLVRATTRAALRAMSDPDLWARVQERKEQMYRDGRLQREEEKCPTERN